MPPNKEKVATEKEQQQQQILKFFGKYNLWFKPAYNWNKDKGSSQKRWQLREVTLTGTRDEENKREFFERERRHDAYSSS